MSQRLFNVFVFRMYKMSCETHVVLHSLSYSPHPLLKKAQQFFFNGIRTLLPNDFLK
jgi:hypothetical protein